MLRLFGYFVFMLYGCSGSTDKSDMASNYLRLVAPRSGRDIDESGSGSGFYITEIVLLDTSEKKSDLKIEEYAFPVKATCTNFTVDCTDKCCIDYEKKYFCIEKSNVAKTSNCNHVCQDVGLEGICCPEDRCCEAYVPFNRIGLIIHLVIIPISSFFVLVGLFLVFRFVRKKAKERKVDVEPNNQEPEPKDPNPKDPKPKDPKTKDPMLKDWDSESNSPD